MDGDPPLDPPHGPDAQSARSLLRQLAEDATRYARAEATYLKAEIGDRTSHIAPALALYGVAAILAITLIIAVVVITTLWAGLVFGFGWALLGLILVLGLSVWLLIRAGRQHVEKAMRPWEKP